MTDDLATASHDPAAYQTIRMRRRGATATIELNRPDRMNAWNPALARELGEAVRAVAADDAVHAVLITGAGGRFPAART